MAEVLGGGRRKQAELNNFPVWIHASQLSLKGKTLCIFIDCYKIHSAILLAAKVFNYEAGMGTRRGFVILSLLAVIILPNEQQ